MHLEGTPMMYVNESKNVDELSGLILNQHGRTMEYIL